MLIQLLEKYHSWLDLSCSKTHLVFTIHLLVNKYY